MLVPNGGHLGLFLPPITTKITYKWIAETKYNWKSVVLNVLTYTGPSPGPLPSPAMELIAAEDGRGVWEAGGDLRGIGEGDLSNSSSWWDDASSDGRCGGVGLGGAFFLEEDFFVGFLGYLFPLPRSRPLPAIRRIWLDRSKWMISIYNTAVAEIQLKNGESGVCQRPLYPVDRRHEIANQTLGYRYTVVCTLTNR